MCECQRTSMLIILVVLFVFAISAHAPLHMHINV